MRRHSAEDMRQDKRPGGTEFLYSINRWGIVAPVCLVPASTPAQHQTEPPLDTFLTRLNFTKPRVSGHHSLYCFEDRSLVELASTLRDPSFEMEWHRSGEAMLA